MLVKSRATGLEGLIEKSTNGVTVEVMTVTIVRIIYASFPPDQAEKARQNWKGKCAPLMIRQSGCMSEELLSCIDSPGEFMSYSEWDSMENIQKYLQSGDHQEIKRQNRNITGAQVVVKHYELVS